MGINWAETGFSALYFAVIARFLGPGLYGQWAYGIAAYTLIIGFVGFGFDALVSFRLGRDKRGDGDFLGLALTLRLMQLAVGAGALAAYALAAEPDRLSRLVLLLLIPALLGRGVALAVRTCFIAYERMADYAKFVALFRSAEACCGIAYLAGGGGLIGIIVLHALLWVGEAAFGLWQIRSRLTRYKPRFAWRPASELLSQGAVLGLSAAGYTWLATGPIIMLRHAMTGMAQVGQFAIVFSLTMMLVGSAHAFFFAALPVLSRSTPRADTAMGYGRLTALAVVVVAAAAAGMGWLLGPPVAQWALGARYAVAGALLPPFLLIGGVILAPTAYAQMLFLSGRRWTLALADITGGLWLAAALLPAAAARGLDGAIAATASAWALRAVLLIVSGELDASRARRMTAAGELRRDEALPAPAGDAGLLLDGTDP